MDLYRLIIHYPDGTVSDTILDEDGIELSIAALEFMGYRYSLIKLKTKLDQNGFVEIV